MQLQKNLFVPIPNISPAPNLHLGVQYFIPEWDDRVDSGFDFLTDSFSPNRKPYDDIYAHQIYPKPNYDGILISRTVIDKSKKKKAYIETYGIRQLIKYQGKIMGDCGAFGYIKEEKPPYTIDEILDYYKQLNVDYGVSIDHLIVGQFAAPGIREKRYELTLNNAFWFMQKYRDRSNSNFTPIGVAQGWNPESYASAVQELIKMGYTYIALGGIARAPTQYILEILMAVRPYLKPHIKLHIFGVGRINAVPAFRHLGVTSFDSASPLRSAWLDSASNYHTIFGKTYAAIRIPLVDGYGVRIKRILAANKNQTKLHQKLKKLEQESLQAMRDFDAGKLSLEKSLKAVLAYDELLELPRDGQVKPEAKARRQQKHAEMYRELLEDKPWKYCDCRICQELGAEVVIFRGNDRNRRRGFHNTYIFYKRFQELLQ